MQHCELTIEEYDDFHENKYYPVMGKSYTLTKIKNNIYKREYYFTEEKKKQKSQTVSQITDD